jgi:hypothetical protein
MQAFGVVTPTIAFVQLAFVVGRRKGTMKTDMTKLTIVFNLGEFRERREFGANSKHQGLRRKGRIGKFKDMGRRYELGLLTGRGAGCGVLPSRIVTAGAFGVW